MKILVIGSGGREHALAWKAAASDGVEEVVVAPGNAGTAAEPGMRNAPVSAEDLDGQVRLAREERIDLTIVGPEAPLAAGIVDQFSAAGLACFGPTRHAARLESSKAYAKEFLARHGIPTAAYAVAEDLEQGIAHARKLGFPVVLKADGLAAGKGVIIAKDEASVATTLKEMLTGKAFGDAGRKVVVEEFLTGEEASYIVIADGARIVPLASSQDHKRRDAGDAGPNTGGMGAYSPAPVVDAAAHERIMREIMQPAIEGMASDGHPFTGFLYAGLMMTPAGPKVLEFNVRFGDPEAQPVLMRLKSDLVAVLQNALTGRLEESELNWDERVALGVVLASGGYPGAYVKGKVISGLDTTFPAHVKVFHAGTGIDDGKVVTAGGRVLCVTALGEDVAMARSEVYRWLEHIRFENAYWRPDIGHRAIDRDSGLGTRDSHVGDA